MAIKLKTISVEIAIGALYLVDVLSGLVESVVKNMFAPAVAVSITDWVVLKVPPERFALTVGAIAGMAVGAGVLVVFDPPPQPETRRIITLSFVSFRNFMAGIFVIFPSIRLSALRVPGQIFHISVLIFLYFWEPYFDHKCLRYAIGRLHL
tara:strand:- start:363 stop:815 length:453 start_codon:yes stop_codon:yes gene_type:complete